MCHHRSALAKDIWEAMFKICFKVPKIKASAGSSKIADWKKNPYVAEAYDSLWNVDESGLITINKIITKAMSKEDCSRFSIVAFTLAICCIVLNPLGNDIKCHEEVTKKRYVIFLVSEF